MEGMEDEDIKKETQNLAYPPAFKLGKGSRKKIYNISLSQYPPNGSTSRPLVVVATSILILFSIILNKRKDARKKNSIYFCAAADLICVETFIYEAR